jgi:hypothetical protein
MVPRDIDDDDDDDDHINTNTPRPPNPRPTPLKRTKLKVQPIENPRLIRQGPKKFKFIFTPIFSGEAFVHLHKSGSDFSERLEVHTFNDEELINGEFKTDFKGGERYEIDFSLLEEFKGAMEIYLVKKIEANVE